ncbi:unnamed protein product [Closterium sp. NIES-54]
MGGPSAPPLGLLATARATTTTTAIAATGPAATAATAAPAYCATMASLRVLAFDHKGRPVAFDTWHDDLQLYLLSDIKDSVSLFDHVFGVAPAPPATADGATRSQLLSCDATARLAIRNHLLVAECTHFGQHRTAQALYDAVVARYSSPATAALGRLLLPYLFLELSAISTVADLVTHLCTSDARYRATVPAEFLATNQPPVFITLYFIVSRLSDSLRSVRDHFLSLDPTSLTIDLLEQHLLAAETSAVAVGAARGTPRPPFFEGMSGLLRLVQSAATSRARVAGVVAVAAVVVEVAAGVMVGAAVGVVAAVGLVAGRGAMVAAVEATEGVMAVEAVGLVVVGLDLSVEALVVVIGSSSSVGARPSRPSSSVSGWFSVGRVGVTCEKLHTVHHCFSRLDDAWHAEFGDDVERPRWADLLRSGVAIFDLDYDAIISAMYALSFSAEGDCYRCVPPDPDRTAAALGASASGTVPAEALHTFTLDSGASRCFFRDSTTLTPLPAPVPVRLADPSRGPVIARSSTFLPCPAVPSGSLSGLHLPSFSTNLVNTATLQDVMVTTTTPGGQRVSICMCTRTGRHLATFTRRPGSSLYTLATKPPQVAASAQVSASGQVAASCSCRLLSHQTLLWHRRLGHPFLPRLRGMHSRLLVSSLPRSLPPLPPSPAPPCLPCVEGRQRAAPHSSSFPPTTAPLQTLHMDVWGPARVSGQGRGRYFLLVVDDYTRYTTVFPLRSKGEVSDVLIPWSRTVRLQLRERFGQDLPVLRLHSDRGGEFSSDLLRDFFRGEGILQSFTLPDSPQQNGIAERHIGLVMEVARTSMIHAAAPHFLSSFAVRYAAHQLNLLPCVSLPETSPTLRWTGKVGDVSVFWVSGSRAFVRDRSADKLSARAIFCGPAPSGVSQVDPLPGTAPVQVAVGSGATPSAVSGGATGEEPGGAELEGVEPGGAESEGAESGGAAPRGAASSGAFVAGGAGDTGAGGAGVTAGAGGTGGIAATSPGCACASDAGAALTGCVGGAVAGDPTEPGATGAGGAGVGGPGAGGAGAAGAGAVDPGAGGAGGTVRPRPYFSRFLSQLPLQLASPLPAPSPYTEQSGGLTKRREPASRPVSPIRPVRRVPRLRPPPVPGTHAMALRPSSVPLRVPLPAPPESSLPEAPDPESNRARAASPTVSRLLTTTLTDTSFEYAAASALVAELLDFAAACRLDYTTALVAESTSASPPSVGDPDAPDIPTLRSYAEGITCPYSSQWQAAMDVEMASWKSTSTYVDEVPPPGANIVDGMWIFRVKRLPGSPPAFKACYIARGFSQRQGVEYFQTFSPTPKMTTLRVLLHVAAQRDYELHSLDFSTLQGSLHEEIWLRRPPGFTGSFPADTQWSLR